MQYLYDPSTMMKKEFKEIKKKAIISEKYGTPDTLKVGEVDKPIPKDKEVLVKVYASSINFGNLALLTGKPLPVRLAFGLKKPKYRIPGGDIAGVVEAIGNPYRCWGCDQFRQRALGEGACTRRPFRANPFPCARYHT